MSGSRSNNPLRIALAGMVSLASVMGIGRFIYTPILPEMADALGLSASQAGLIASANYLGYLAGALIGASRWIGGSPRRWFFAGFVLSIFTTLAMGVPSSMPAYLAIRFLGGIASALVVVFSAQLIIERLVLSGKAHFTGFQFGGVGIGIAYSAGLVALLIANGAEWQHLWISGGLSALIGLIIAAILLRNSGQPEEIAVQRSGAIGGTAFWLLFVSYGLFGFGYVITATFIVAIVRASPTLAALEPAIWMVVGLSGIPSIWFWNWVANRTSQIMAYGIAFLIEALGVYLSVAFDAPWAVIAAAAILGGTFLSITAIGLGYGRVLSNADPRRIFAVLTCSFGAGQIVGPVVAGYLHDVTGSYAPGSYAAAIALVIGAALAFMVPRFSPR